MHRLVKCVLQWLVIVGNEQSNITGNFKEIVRESWKFPKTKFVLVVICKNTTSVEWRHPKKNVSYDILSRLFCYLCLCPLEIYLWSERIEFRSECLLVPQWRPHWSAADIIDRVFMTMPLVSSNNIEKAIPKWKNDDVLNDEWHGFLFSILFFKNCN